MEQAMIVYLLVALNLVFNHILTAIPKLKKKIWSNSIAIAADLSPVNLLHKEN